MQTSKQIKLDYFNGHVRGTRILSKVDSINENCIQGSIYRAKRSVKDL